MFWIQWTKRTLNLYPEVSPEVATMTTVSTSLSPLLAIFLFPEILFPPPQLQSVGNRLLPLLCDPESHLCWMNDLEPSMWPLKGAQILQVSENDNCPGVLESEVEFKNVTWVWRCISANPSIQKTEAELSQIPGQPGPQSNNTNKGGRLCVEHES